MALCRNYGNRTLTNAENVIIIGHDGELMEQPEFPFIQNQEPYEFEPIPPEMKYTQQELYIIMLEGNRQIDLLRNLLDRACSSREWYRERYRTLKRRSRTKGE